MPAIPIKSSEHYIKALEVLDRVGGQFSGVGDAKHRVILVSPRQYEALAAANALTLKTPDMDSKRGKESRKRPKS